VWYGAVTGCADLKLSTLFWIKRTDTEATVGCQSNGRTWRLVCRGTSWLGDVGNCSAGGDDVLGGGGARLPTMTSAAYHISDDVDDETALDFTSSLPTGWFNTPRFVLLLLYTECVYTERQKRTELNWIRSVHFAKLTKTKWTEVLWRIAVSSLCLCNATELKFHFAVSFVFIVVKNLMVTLHATRDQMTDYICFEFSGKSLPYLTLPPGWTGSYTCPALRPYQLGPMRVPECNQKVTGSGHKAVTPVKP